MRPTVSQLSQSLTTLRLNPTYTAARERLRLRLRELPALGELAYSGVHSVTSALREMVAPHTFFEALGVRYAGPIDGHDIEHMEQAFTHAAEWDGPIVVHVLTQKGRGYAPAEEDDVQRLHDVKATRPSPSRTRWAARPARRRWLGRRPTAAAWPRRARYPRPRRTPSPGGAATYTDAFTRALLAAAEDDPRIVALTAAMPGPTGLLPFQARFPDRFFDVGIAEQHEVTAAAGMAMAGLRPVVAVYSTFWSPRLRPGQPRRRPARLPGRLRARPGRHHRRRRAEPPRHPRPGPGALHPGHDGLRAVVGRGGRADAAHRARRCPGRRPSACPRRRPVTWTRDEVGQRARRPASCAPATARSACSAWARRSEACLERRRRAGRRGRSTRRCGTCGWCRRPTPRCSPTPRATGWW